MVTLCDLKPRSEALILEFTETSVAAARLIELGFVPGRTVRVLSRLPFGGPVVVNVGETFVALRREEAQCIRVRAA